MLNILPHLLSAPITTPIHENVVTESDIMTGSISKESVSFNTQVSTSSSLLNPSLFITDDDASIDELMNR